MPRTQKRPNPYRHSPITRRRGEGFCFFNTPPPASETGVKDEAPAIKQELDATPVNLSTGTLPQPREGSAAANSPAYTGRVTATITVLGDLPSLRIPVFRSGGRLLIDGEPVNREAYLAQCSGIVPERICKECHWGQGPWKECVLVPGTLGGSCANCHFEGNGKRCSIRLNIAIQNSPLASTTGPVTPFQQLWQKWEEASYASRKKRVGQIKMELNIIQALDLEQSGVWVGEETEDEEEEEEEEEEEKEQEAEAEEEGDEEGNTPTHSSGVTYPALPTSSPSFQTYALTSLNNESPSFSPTWPLVEYDGLPADGFTENSLTFKSEPGPSPVELMEISNALKSMKRLSRHPRGTTSGDHVGSFAPIRNRIPVGKVGYQSKVKVDGKGN